jgi:alkylhydroperoxidase family enzyme
VAGGRHAEGIERLRAAARPARSAPSELEPYLEKVRHHAYRVTDADLDALRALGFDEDELFEQTVSVAVGAGLARLDAALGVLR